MKTLKHIAGIDVVLLQYQQSPCPSEDDSAGWTPADSRGFARGGGANSGKCFAFGEGCGSGYGESEWSFGAPHIAQIPRDATEEMAKMDADFELFL